MYKFIPYVLTNHTNLHVGSGEANIGIVDNQVQRDSTTGLPVINASSFKGAIRDHFFEYLSEGDNDMQADTDPDAVKPHHYRVIFGLEQKEQEAIARQGKTPLSKRYAKLPKQGLVNFMEARMLFLPVRGRNKAFYHATSVEILEDYSRMLKHLGYTPPEGEYDNLKYYIPMVLHAGDKRVVFDQEKDTIEGYFECAPHEINEDILKLKKLFGIDHLVLLPHSDLMELVEELPVIARNKLDNGISENLWYEEIVPRETIFGVVLGYYDRIAPGDAKPFIDAFKSFEAKLTDYMIQIGANASIGYGLCEIRPMGVSYRESMEPNQTEEVSHESQED